MSDGLLTPKGAAAYCAVHYRTFLDAARAEGLRPVGMFGKRARYSIAQLDQFVRLMRARAEAAAAKKAGAWQRAS